MNKYGGLLKPKSDHTQRYKSMSPNKLYPGDKTLEEMMNPTKLWKLGKRMNKSSNSSKIYK